jgi:rod shape-determining protein MreD
MRRHLFAAILLALLAFIEASVFPRLLGDLPRANLVLIMSCAWASLRGNEGFVWALGGGVMLDLLSSAPFGTHTAGLVLGNTVALLLNRLPLPAEFFRVTNWVAVATVVFHLSMLGFLAIAQRPYDLSRALTTAIIPLLAINPVLSLGAFAVLAPLQRQLNEQERFARG